MKIQLVGAITNIVLDPLLIFGLIFFPELGVSGAAIATVIGQICAMIYSLSLVLKNKNSLKLQFSKFHFKIEITKEIFKVSIPAIFMLLLNSIMITGINFILAGFSGTSVAAFGAYFKLQSFIYMPIFGLTQGMMPIIGYNYGAKNRKRVVDALLYGALYSGVIMMIGTILFQVFPKELLSLFKPTEEMSAIGVICLRRISIGFVFSGVVIVLSAFFQALGKAKISLLISFARQIIFLLPFAYGLSQFFGLKGVWTAFPLSETLSLIIGVIFAAKVMKGIAVTPQKEEETQISSQKEYA